MAAYGYARVSKADQTLDSQLLALRQAGIAPELTTAETVSGGMPSGQRPGLSALLSRLQPGDSLAVARLDRLGRDALDTLGLLRDLETRGVAIRLLDFGADTGTPIGRMIVGVLASMAAWERDVLRERTRQGMAAARDRGERIGRLPRLTPHQAREAGRMAGEGRSVTQVARLLDVSRSIAHRAMAAHRPAPSPA